MIPVVDKSSDASRDGDHDDAATTTPRRCEDATASSSNYDDYDYPPPPSPIVTRRQWSSSSSSATTISNEIGPRIRVDAISIRGIGSEDSAEYSAHAATTVGTVGTDGLRKMRLLGSIPDARGLSAVELTRKLMDYLPSSRVGMYHYRRNCPEMQRRCLLLTTRYARSDRVQALLGDRLRRARLERESGAEIPSVVSVALYAEPTVRAVATITMAHRGGCVPTIRMLREDRPLREQKLSLARQSAMMDDYVIHDAECQHADPFLDIGDAPNVTRCVACADSRWIEVLADHPDATSGALDPFADDHSQLLETRRFFLHRNGARCCGETPRGAFDDSAVCPWHLWGRMHVTYIRDRLLGDAATSSLIDATADSVNRSFAVNAIADKGFYTCGVYNVAVYSTAMGGARLGGYESRSSSVPPPLIAPDGTNSFVLIFAHTEMLFLNVARSVGPVERIAIAYRDVVDCTISSDTVVTFDLGNGESASVEPIARVSRVLVGELARCIAHNARFIMTEKRCEASIIRRGGKSSTPTSRGDR